MLSIKITCRIIKQTEIEKVGLYGSKCLQVRFERYKQSYDRSEDSVVQRSGVAYLCLHKDHRFVGALES